jgi:hypothetical protein
MNEKLPAYSFTISQTHLSPLHQTKRRALAETKARRLMNL